MGRNGKQKLLPVSLDKPRTQLEQLTESSSLASSSSHPVSANGTRKVAFLVLSGSFNPVHTGHFAVLAAAAKEVTAKSGLPVIAGFLAPCSDEDLYRCPESGEALNHLARCALCSAASESSEWIDVCSWGWSSSSRITERIERQFADRLSRTGGRHWEFEGWHVLGRSEDVHTHLQQKSFPFTCIAHGSDAVLKRLMEVAQCKDQERRPAQTSSLWRRRYFTPAAEVCSLTVAVDADSERIRQLVSAEQWSLLIHLRWLPESVLSRLQDSDAAATLGEDSPERRGWLFTERTEVEPPIATADPEHTTPPTENVVRGAKVVQPLETSPSDIEWSRKAGRVHYSNGDAAKASQCGGRKIIAHVCNDQGNGGRGYFQAIKKELGPGPSRAYFEWHRDRSQNDFRLGGCQIVQVNQLVEVANMIGQQGHKSGSKGGPARPEAIQEALELLGNHAAAVGASVHIPHSSCNRWEQVGPLLKSMAQTHRLQIYVYKE